MPPHTRKHRGTDSDLHPARCGASCRHRASVLLPCFASAALDTSSSWLIVRVQSAYNLSVFEHYLFQTTAQDHLELNIEDDIEDEFHLSHLPHVRRLPSPSCVGALVGVDVGHDVLTVGRRLLSPSLSGQS
ncbi:hypothetical protein A0H81_14049 [Grifola frondosa]|uniref:Uncharacterized protein n=1 Tax=Grifola frondosa TaxID=5627 RepID=A0A1C7LPQ9_GRIFR|nr:hypothetical protein A0H81_14049 [Grifola frondosa]